MPQMYRAVLAPSRSLVPHILLIASTTAVLVTCPPRSDGAPPEEPPDMEAFVTHLDALIPALLERANVPGAAAALVEDGIVRWSQGYGAADIEAERSATPDTIFNVGSISKTVTAWAVMRLVEEGKMDLHAPIARYLKRWRLPTVEFDADQVTVARLLSHTAGVSLSAVAEYGPDEDVPALPEALADDRHNVRIVQKPGTAWSYSGGGYMLLQLAVEDVTGAAFDELVGRSVLEPLGMTRSSFDATQLPAAQLATPYDESGTSLPHHRYAGLAAAGLYTTANDLARFVAAGLGGGRAGALQRPLLRPDSIRFMQTPADATRSRYLKYGLGYNLIPLPGGGFSAGHAGSNTGWMAVMSTIPEQRDGFVLLTNSSKGVAVYRWALCDWISWKTGRSWTGFCDGRAEQPGGTLHGPEKQP